MPTGSTEVDPREALKEDADSALEEARQSIDQAPEPPEGEAPVSGPEDEVIDVIDTIKPKAERKVWKVVDDKAEPTVTREYVQEPLSYFAKMEFFGLVGEVIDKAVSGEDGLKVSSLFDMPTRGGQLSAADFRDADTFVQAVGKLLTYAPDFLQKCYCIWWGVPEYERSWVIEVISRSPAQGGLSDREGMEAVEIFIDQNWEALEAFFRDEISSLRDRVQARRKEAESRRSKRSNGTPPPTQSE